MPTEDEWPDKELMLAASQGNEDALATLLQRHHSRLYAYFARIVGPANQAEIEDLVQEVWLQVVRSSRRFNIERSFPAWLFTIARNIANDRARMRRRAIHEELSEKLEIVLPDDLPTVTLSDFGDIDATVVNSSGLHDSDFRISFASDLSEQQVRGTLEAVADYYRACGGVGLEVEFDGAEIAVLERTVV